MSRSQRPSLKIVIVGHVDHGKSSLIGRLFHDTDSLPTGKVEAIRAMCEARGMPMEYAFLMDALQAERDQGITIDTAQIRFKSAARDYVIIDAPGHKEFLKNMVSGAANADAAVLVVDAAEGVREQTRRHGYLLHLLGVRQVAVVINKIDLVDYDRTRYDQVVGEVKAYLDEIDIAPAAIIPISAREGDNIVAASANTPWYDGPSVLAQLDAFAAGAPETERPLRLMVQDVYKFDDRRIIAGRIESGRVRVGDEVVFSPSEKRVKIASIEAWNTSAPAVSAAAGQSVGLTLEDQIFVERGEVISHVDHAPLLTNRFRARLFWLGTSPLIEGQRYTLKLGPAEYPVEVETIEKVVDVEDLSTHEADAVGRNAVAEVVLRARGLMALDPFEVNPKTGRFVIIDGYDIAGGGIVDMHGFADQRRAAQVKSQNIFAVEHGVDTAQRWAANGHRSGILWLTGLSGAGKSTLALELEARLFRKGYQVFVLDGDNIRHGLSADLGFAPEDRAENIRRVGEVAKLFAESGVIVITAFISPYRADRYRVREIAGDLFHEVYVNADVATCASRDPKGLYARAAKGEIPEFTGVSAPYEVPENPEVTVDTRTDTVEQSAARLVDYVEQNFATRPLSRLTGTTTAGDNGANDTETPRSLAG